MIRSMVEELRKAGFGPEAWGERGSIPHCQPAREGAHSEEACWWASSSVLGPRWTR